MVGAMIAVMPYNANAKPRWCGGKVSARMAWAIGCRPPPPAPCSTRKKSSIPRLGAIAQSRELTVKKPRQAMKKRLRPSAPASQPLIGRTIAFDTRYEVRTHVLWSLLAPRLPAIYGKATLAMLVSRTSMKAASATTTAISQGLYLGRQTSWSMVRAAELIAPNSLEIHVRHHVHAWSKPAIPVFPRIENDLYRNPLDNFHVVSGGILRRK